MSPRAVPQVLLFTIENTLAASFQALVEACEEARRVPAYHQLGCFTATHLAEAIDRSRVWFWSASDRAARAQRDLRSARGEFVGRALIKLGLEPFDDLVGQLDDLAAFIYCRQHARQRLFPHSRQCLHQLKKAGLRLGLIQRCDGPRADSLLSAAGIRTCFEHVIDLDPQPRSHLMDTILSRFAQAPEACVLVSNRLSDEIDCAIDQGLHTIWINRPPSGQHIQPGHRPDHVLASTAQLPQLFQPPGTAA